jgi:uncharacterized membrane protein
VIQDLGLAGIFLAFLLLEGVRRPASGAVVIRRFGFGAWRMRGETRWYLRLVSLLPPFTCSVLLTPSAPEEECDKAAVQQRWHLARRASIPLHLLGGLITLGLLVGLPLALDYLSVWGFLLAALVVLVLTALSALLGSATLQRMGMPAEMANQMARKWLSPFAAPGVAEGIMELALADAPVPFAARLVLPDSELREWLRPRAYDLMVRRTFDPELMASFPAHMLLTLVRSQPLDVDPAASAWCPRCGNSYRTTDDCAECEVPVLAMKLSETWEGFRTTLPDEIPELPKTTGLTGLTPGH